LKVHSIDPKIGVQAATSSYKHLHATLLGPQLHSLTLGWLMQEIMDGYQLSQRAVAAVVDALSKSGLPFLDPVGVLDNNIRMGHWLITFRRNQPPVSALTNNRNQEIISVD
jgi:hypothetical protein